MIGLLIRPLLDIFIDVSIDHHYNIYFVANICANNNVLNNIILSLLDPSYLFTYVNLTCSDSMHVKLYFQLVDIKYLIYNVFYTVCFIATLYTCHNCHSNFSCK